MSMFAKANVIKAPAAPKAGKTKVEAPIKDLELVAELDALIKAATALKASAEASVKAAAYDIFIEEGHKIERRPTNFRGTDGIASASVELRKRAANSVLNAEQVALVEAHGMKPEKKIITVEMFGINPVYSTDTKLLNAVNAALEHIVPADFIVLQEEKSAMIVTDQMLDQAFHKDVPREVVETVTVLALKPKLEVTDIPAIMQKLQSMLTADDEDTNETKVAAVMAAK